MKVFLIDANSLIYRVYHALPRFEDYQNRPVQALYGLANILLKILKENKFDFIFALYDRPEPTLRHKVFKEYKITRPKATEDLISQISLSKRIFSAFNILTFEKIGYEADDLIASLKEYFKSKADEIIILTGDLDTLQLVDSKTKILTMQKGITKNIVYDEEKVMERFGVLPSQIVDFKALVGDASDNIAGISGIGIKTASRLLNKYLNIEGIIKACENKEIEEKIAQEILKNKEKIIFNKSLITLKKDLKFDDNLISPYFGFDKNKVLEVFKEFGFKSLIERITKNEKKEEVSDSSYSSKNNLFNFLKPNNLLSNIKKPFLFFLQDNLIKIDDGSGDLKLLDKKFLEDLLEIDCEKFTFDFKEILKELLGKDFYFDKKINLNQILDLKIILWLLNPERKDISLEKFMYLKDELHFNNNKNYLKIASELIDKLAEFGLTNIYFEIELPLTGVLSRMEKRGIGFDLNSFEIFKEKVKEKTEILLEELKQLAGENFNPNSHLQTRKILFEKLKLNYKILTKTQKGEISTQEQELLKIAHLHPIVLKIIEHRRMVKLLTYYTDSLLKRYDKNSRRIYSFFNQTASSTGRIISENPNLQNLPIEGDLAILLRDCFKAQEGFVLISGDYSQIELRLLAYLSQDDNLKSAFKNDLDIHSQTAKFIFGDDSPLNRKKAKIINFSIIYGISPKNLANNLQVPISEASKLIERFFYFYPAVKKFKEEKIEFVKTYGYIENIFKRKRFLKEINYSSYSERKSAERIAVNMPIQSLAADIIKKAMIDLDNEIFKKRLEAFLVLSIHDELIFEVNKKISKEFKILIKDKMENAFFIDQFPLKVNLRESETLSFK